MRELGGPGRLSVWQGSLLRALKGDGYALEVVSGVGLEACHTAGRSGILTLAHETRTRLPAIVLSCVSLPGR